MQDEIPDYLTRLRVFPTNGDHGQYTHIDYGKCEACQRIGWTTPVTVSIKPRIERNILGFLSQKPCSVVIPYMTVRSIVVWTHGKCIQAAPAVAVTVWHEELP